MFQGKSSLGFGTKSSPENYILISNNQFFREQLEKQLGKRVAIQDILSLKKSTSTEIIFDQNYLNFKVIIQALETNKNKGFTFKIIPKSSQFMIGSNSSFDRGEIVKIENFR